jgi:hypothetical protein
MNKNRSKDPTYSYTQERSCCKSGIPAVVYTTLKYGIIGLLIAIFFSCTNLEPIGMLEDYSFKVFPHVYQKDSSYVLVYQLNTEMKDGSPTMMTFAGSSVRDDTAYFYFQAVASFFESEDGVEIVLDNEKFGESANQNAVYWLNKDNSKVRLDIID